MSAPANLPSANYTTGEVRARIGVYIALAALTAAGSGVLNLATMTDAQLATLSALRWTLTILSILISVVVAGLNAYRAAIDRSTAGGNDATAGTSPSTASPLTGSHIP